MGFAGEKAGKNNILKWTFSDRASIGTLHEDLSNIVEKLIGYRDLTKKNMLTIKLDCGF